MIVITGATGKLGTHVVNQLLAKGLASSVRVAVRSPEKAAEWAELGVEIAQADYEDSASLEAAFEGAEKVLLISSSAVGSRLEHHKNVIDAAKKAGVEFIAYTSILHADQSKTILAQEHRPTEALIRESGLEYVLLRNGWYTENYTENFGAALGGGGFIGSAGDGRISAATRADYAAAAVAVLTEDGHAGKTYELAGDTSFSMAELAAEVSRITGKTLPYTDMPEETYAKTLESFGLPAGFAGALADADSAIARGELEDNDGALRELIGRATTPWKDTVAEALA